MYKPTNVIESSAQVTESEKQYIEKVLYEIFRKYFCKALDEA